MTEQAPHMNSDLEERFKRLSNRSAEEEFLDAVGGAMIRYKEEVSKEAEQWKNAYNTEKAKNEYLVKMLIQNGILVPDFSLGVPPSIPEDAVKNKKVKHFKDLIQVADKEGFLSRLHKRIDGLGGKNVALILLRAKEDKQISKLPSKIEFCSEFRLEGNWRSISHFFSPNCIPTPDISAVVI